MKFLKQRGIALSIFAALFSTNALADTLDFTTLSQGSQGTTVLVFPQATITSFGSDIYVGASAIASEICPLTNAFNCQADLQIDFTSAVNDLSFVLAGYDAGDHLDINIFSGTSLLGTIARQANGLVDLSAYSNITKLYFDDSSVGAGFSYDKFQFTVAAVPEADTYGMLLAGLGLLGFATRRKQA